MDLPIPTLTKSALAALTALSIALLPATPAQAWSDREQGVLTGVLGTLILQGIARGTDGKGGRPYPQPQPYPQPYPQPQPYPGNYPPPAPPVYQGSIYGTTLARAFNGYSVRDRMAIQRSLYRQGYYRSGIDGAFGQGTYRALAAYARDTGQDSVSMAGAYGVCDSLLY